MAKYINADLLRKEIEKERKSIDGLFTEGDNSFYDGQDDAYNHTLALIESLQQEPDKSLEEAAEEYFCRNWSDGSLDIKPQVKEDFKAGAEWQKKQMMKEAVEGEVIKTDKHTSVRYKAFYGTDRYFYGIADKQFKPGDKVRIIIAKGDEK